jgi:splicing factor 3B subunit 3
MKLYSLTLHRPSFVTCSAYGEWRHVLVLGGRRQGDHALIVAGSFTGKGRHEFVVARGSLLELLRPDASGQLHVVLSTNTFSIVRALSPFRLPGSKEDFVLVSSDSGKVSLLKADELAGCFKRVHLETFGYSGCRRIIPGELAVVDPRGRAVMLAAVEKRKLVWVLSRDGAGDVSISSPLEASKAHSFCFSACGVDVGFDNPIFACLELDYEGVDEDPTGEVAANTKKQVVYYELDLGLNHVVRRWAEETDRSANLVLGVAGGEDGPSGVLVCAQGWVLYHSETQSRPLRTPIPRRRDLPDERQVMVVAHTAHRSKGAFFVVLQSEQGDLYKVSLDVAGSSVNALSVQYLDTIAPCQCLALSKTGLLLASTVAGDQLLYEFQSDGSDDPDAVVSTVSRVRADELDEDEVECPVFKPRPLTVLSLAGTVTEIAPLLHSLPADLRGDGEVTLLSLSGLASRSSLRLMRHGSPVTEIATSPLPGVASTILSVCPTKLAAEAAATSIAMHVSSLAATDLEHAASTASKAALEMAGKHALLIVSFKDASLVLEVGEDVQELEDSSLNTGVPTLAVTMLEDGSVAQVHPSGLRRVRNALASLACSRAASGLEGGFPASAIPERKVAEWRPPAGKTVTAGAATPRQVCLVVEGENLVYFELDPEGHGTDALEKCAEAALPPGVLATCVDLGEIALGARRSPFLAVGDSLGAVRVFSMNPASRLHPLASVALTSPPASVALADLSQGSANSRMTLCLFAGLASGALCRADVDPVTGRIAAFTSRLVGARPVSLARTRLGGGRAAVLALSSRPWVVVREEGGQGKILTTPLATTAMDAATPLVTNEISEGVVGVSDGFLRIWASDQVGSTFAHDILSLRYTPRKIVAVPSTSALNPPATALGGSSAAGPALSFGGGTSTPFSQLVCVVESDHNAFTSDELAEIQEAYDAVDREQGLAPDAAEGEDEEMVGPDGFGTHPQRVGRPVPPDAGKWASCVRLVDVSTMAQQYFSLMQDAAAEEEEEPVVSGSTIPPGCMSKAGSACTLCVQDLPSNTAAFSAACVEFATHPDEVYLAVGVATGLTYHPMKMERAGIRLYRVRPTTADPTSSEASDPTSDSLPLSMARATLEFVHETECPAVPLALAGINGKLVAGVGPALISFALGQKQLLRKRVSPIGHTRIVAILPTGLSASGGPFDDEDVVATGERVWCADAEEGVMLLSYRHSDDTAVVLSDETAPRHVTSIAVLDTDTVAVGDKFGTISVLRAPEGVDDEGASASTGAQTLWENTSVKGAATRLTQECRFYTGSAVTSVQRTALAGGHEVVLFTTITGQIGALLPVALKSDVRLLEHLEMYLRSRGDLEDASSLPAAERLAPTGRVHVAYRSFYGPVKGVVDGDLCEQFLSLPLPFRKGIAEDLTGEEGVLAGAADSHDDSGVGFVTKRLEEMRAKIL